MFELREAEMYRQLRTYEGVVMKNYINSQDRTRHILILSIQETLNEFCQSNSLSEEEKKMLSKAYTQIIKFNKSLFERFGDAYRRKIEKTMEANVLRLEGKYAIVNECVSHSAVEDLNNALNELRMFNCMECDKQEFTKCGTYACFIACDIEGAECSEGCPFRL